MVDPETGMAYLLDEENRQVYVWPVTVEEPGGAGSLVMDKIATSRIGTVGENREDLITPEHPESGYITGTWKSENGEESHKASTAVKNGQGSP